MASNDDRSAGIEAALDSALVAQTNAHVHRLAVAEDGQLQSIAGAFARERTADGIVAIDRLAIDGHDEVAAHPHLRVPGLYLLPASWQSSAGRRGVGIHFLNQQAALRWQT